MLVHTLPILDPEDTSVVLPVIPRKTDRILDFAVIDARADSRWCDVASHRFGSLFSSSQWIHAVGGTYDFAIKASVRTSGGRVEAALPFSCISDFRGDRVVSLPFSDYCDPVLDDMESWNQLVRPLLAYNVPVTLRCLRNQVPAGDSRFTHKIPALWHGVDLTRSEEDLWNGLDGSARQNIRKAQRSGVVVHEGRSMEDIRIFHGMHCRLRKSKYRLLAQPLSFFENLYNEFQRTDGINVLIAERDGEPIAGIVLLEFNGTLYYKFNASLDQQYCPNDLLAWNGLLCGRRRGMVQFDFGLSDLEQPGLVRYKRKFATEEREISFLQWRPEGYSNPKGEQAGDVLRRVTGWLTDPAIPDEITQTAGEKLYRFFC